MPSILRPADFNEATPLADIDAHTANGLNLLLLDADPYVVSIPAPLGTSNYSLVKSVSLHLRRTGMRLICVISLRLMQTQQVCGSRYADPSACAENIADVICQSMEYF
ncbi:unnamed protein product [Pieris brassicae]|uniref:Uncharacterized protein n=1 Tax=Pieris brassicae TaxID=7116 RepID=A0A9P0X2N2_PIEBR|nr:unnamed protein product [Pieris brassicae]